MIQYTVYRFTFIYFPSTITLWYLWEVLSLSSSFIWKANSQWNDHDFDYDWTEHDLFISVSCLIQKMVLMESFSKLDIKLHIFTNIAFKVWIVEGLKCTSLYIWWQPSSQLQFMRGNREQSFPNYYLTFLRKGRDSFLSFDWIRL